MLSTSVKGNNTIFVGFVFQITTDLNLGCTDRHSGTSASAPLAAGMCALALQAK